MSPRIDDLAASFRRSLRAAKKADRTLLLYGQSISYFCDWLTAQGRPATLDEFTRHAVAGWLDHLAEQGNEASTMATRLRGLRRFARWLVAEGEVDKAPTDGVEMPTGADKPVRVLTDDELGRLLDACSVGRGRSGVFDRRVFVGRRDEVMIRILGDCGLRVSELVALDLGNGDDRPSDIDLNREIVYVVGKGNRPRAVPFGAKTGQAIDRYLRIRALHPRATTSTRLLLTGRGAMSADGVRWRMEQLSAETGIEDLHPHALRHTFAHRWLAAGGQERDLMHLAGWRSDAMLKVYARTTAVERAHAAHRRMGLGDRI